MRTPRLAARLAAVGAVCLCLAGWSAPDAALFEVRAPAGLITGRVRLEALSRDPEVGFVRWQSGDRSHTTGKPFEFTVDAGPVPEEKTVVATALDRARRPLYRVETLLNPGGRRLLLSFVTPLDGQSVRGATAVLLRAAPPAGEELVTLALEVDGRRVALDGKGEFGAGTVEVPDAPTVLTARVTTALGRTAERSVLLNARGVSASLDAHVIEQMVGVTKGGEPIEDLRAADFRVRDDAGDCEIREVRLVRDGRLAVGVSVDTSQSLLYTAELRRTVATTFFRILGARDTAFLHRFGVSVGHVLGWTTSHRILEEGVLGLEEDPAPGTLLYTGIVDALYQLQGGEGARALLLVTDGNAFEDELVEKDALAFARQSGVPIFAVALPWVLEVRNPVRVKDADGNVAETFRIKRERQAPNREVLQRFTEATGGRTYVVESAAELPGLFARLERDLRTRYVVSFVSNAKRTASFHPVEIRASRGAVRTAAGFFY